MISRASHHYNAVIMSAMTSQNHRRLHHLLYDGSDADPRKHQTSASLAFVRGIHRWPVNSQHKRPVERKMLPFDDVIMQSISQFQLWWSRGYWGYASKPPQPFIVIWFGKTHKYHCEKMCPLSLYLQKSNDTKKAIELLRHQHGSTTSILCH